ncbi:HPP-domain-containing protein [Marasmius fiardii PR-910]|nr:HPP-domain-containing protein [Marasmius fiardii PR-910]
MAGMEWAARLPPWISRWIGYRAKPQPKLPEWGIWLWTWIGSFCGLCVVQAVFGQASYFTGREIPPIVAGFGASAVLVYGVIDGPISQPRALFAGHFLSALTGVIITKLFRLLPTYERFLELQWLAGALSCSTAIVVMMITKTMHPPAGATALLAAVNQEVRDMGWYYLPVSLLSCALLLAVALLNNNIQRQYPVFWFYPSPPPPILPTAAPTKEITPNPTPAESFEAPRT